MYNFLFYFLLFFVYAVIGFIVEVTYVYIGNKKLVNRGFLIGPYIPIYGFSAVIMVLYLTQYRDNPLTVFLLAIVVCSIMEYAVSFIMEKLFNARWWDYSNYKFNINGRVCLLNSILFGILSILLVYFINPVIMGGLEKINHTLLIIISIICLVIFVTDSVISFVITFNIRDKINSFDVDATTEIRNLINSKLKGKYFHKRVFNAFPKIEFFKKVKK